MTDWVGHSDEYVMADSRATVASIGLSLQLLLVAAPSAALPDADVVVRKIQTRYDATTDFTAEVSQEATIVSLNKTVTAQGTVAFKKPGKMRWEFTSGDPQTIVADGTTLWLYRPADQQVMKMPFDSAFRSSLPFSFLTGVGRLADDFTARVDDEKGGLVHLTLVPRRPSPEVRELHLAVAQDTFDIRGAEVQDPLGNTSRFHFDKLQRNVHLDDQRFRFEVPPGVDVVEAPTK